MPLLLAFLKMLGEAAAKGAIGLGKAAVTGAKAGAKGIGTLAKAGLEKTDAGKLFSAFQGMMQQPQRTAEITELFSPQPAYAGETQPQPQAPLIPEQYQGFGQGQLMAQQPPRGLAGFMQSMGYGALGKPLDMEQRGWEAYAGKLIPDIIRSRMGVTTAGEEAKTQQTMRLQKEVAKQKGKPSPKSLLQMAQTEAFKRMGGGILGQVAMTTEEGKAKYLKMVNDLYQEYLKKFGVSELDVYGTEETPTEALSSYDITW